MISVLIDASVIVKWYHLERELEVPEARAILQAHQADAVTARILDLTVYELGSILLGSLSWPPDDVADQLDELLQVCGAPIALERIWLRDAAELGAAHGLTYYDAAYAAAARGLQVPLITADRKLLASGLAESPAEFVSRMRLPLA